MSEAGVRLPSYTSFLGLQGHHKIRQVQTGIPLCLFLTDILATELTLNVKNIYYLLLWISTSWLKYSSKEPFPLYTYCF